jgi:hypothetical protein
LSKFKHRDIPVLSGYLQATSVVVALARMTTENQKLYYKEMKSGFDGPLDKPVIRIQVERSFNSLNKIAAK